MGGNSETGAGVADCSIGSIVWVRRRNGSWWPGKILGPDELSASHVMSPRSGTPVKLLGREDASVDWYNLEKSKRVKAFRCGEFDDCIEKAEASQGMPPKKREKYARREDAILHALELERQMLEKKCEKVGYSSKGESTVSPYGVKKASLMSSQNLETGNGKHLQPETHQACESLCLPFKAKGEDQDMHAERVKEENQLSVDEDNSGVPPRTRGLQDFGLRTVPLKFKASPVASPNGSHKPSFDSSVQTHSNDGLATEDMVDATSENSTEKRKRSHDSGEDSLAKRRERRRPLLQVLENSSKVLVPHSQADDGNANYTPMSDDEQPGIAFPVKRSRYTCLQPVDLDEENNTGSTEDTETDSSETDSLDSDTDELASLSEGAASIELQPKYPRRSEAWAEDKSLGSEELDELALSDEISKPCYYGPASASMGVSRWQLKGKRNNRSLLKRPVDGSDRNFSWGSIDETMTLEMGANGQDETYSVGKNFMPQMAGHGSRGSDGIGCRTVQGQHWDWNDHRAIKGYWEDAGKYFDPVYVGRHHIGGRSILVDVDLKVQSSYQREHVPMISLMSKINGQAIVGHPIPIEVLENGSSESLLAETDEWSPEIVENETALPPMWRTARRTSNFRVPRPDLSSTCDESAKNLQFVDSRRGHPENSDAGAIGHKGGIMEKHATRVPVDRKFSRKPLKKISLSSNQKIRTLSSIASQQKPSTDSRQSGNNFRVDGLKPESVSTAVACIPVKLVFSRLQEELVGRHS